MPSITKTITEGVAMRMHNPPSSGRDHQDPSQPKLLSALLSVPEGRTAFAG